MKYDIRTYFREHADDEVDGFTVIGSSAGTYQLVEKWNRKDDDPIWHRYSIPEENLIERVNEGYCEPVGQVTEEQLRQLKSLDE